MEHNKHFLKYITELDLNFKEFFCEYIINLLHVKYKMLLLSSDDIMEIEYLNERLFINLSSGESYICVKYSWNGIYVKLIGSNRLIDIDLESDDVIKTLNIIKRKSIVKKLLF
jgi:hypothetical protein